MNSKKIFVGVSWPYANGNIHLGHIAGQNVACDIFARYHRLKGNKILMVSGSDCHGAPIELAAEKNNMTPEEWVKKSHKKILETYKSLNFIYDNYTSTITENHKRIVQNIFLYLKETNSLFIKETMQYYDPKVEKFLPDRYIQGTCPECNTTNARGDECPECGKFLNPEDLIKPYSALSDAKPKLKKTKHYYINLNKNTKELKKWINEFEKHTRTWVSSSTKGFLKEGLEPRPITRDLKFGISVPLKGWEEKKIYVWLENVVGYLSASIEWAEKRENKSEWEDFWKDKSCKHYYFIAGGNLFFHSIIWPTELIGYNKKYEKAENFNKNLLPNEKQRKKLNLPFDIPTNKLLMYKGKKMSKGDNSGITLEHLLKNYDSDLLRYFCTRYAPENHDKEFTWKDFIDANNNELVANLGNFVNRVLTFTATKFDSTIPQGDLSEEVEEEISSAFEKCGKHIEKCEFIKAIEIILNLGHFSNKYFNDKQPWNDFKNNINSSRNTIYNSLQLVNAFRILLKPFLPNTSRKLDLFLNINVEYDPNNELEKTGKVTNFINSWVMTYLDAGTKIKKVEIIFQKLEYSKELEEEDQENVKEIAISKGKDVKVIIDSNLTNIPIIWDTFNNLKIQKRNSDVKKWIEEIYKKIEDKYKGDHWKENKVFEGYRDLHKEYSNSKDLVPSGENLIEIFKKKKRLPNINTCVDIYNAVSALTGVSIGAHDISEIEGDVNFKILEKNYKFKPLTGEKKGFAKSNEYGYIDNNGIICRLDIKQSDRTKITSNTSDALIILQGNYFVTEEDLIRTMRLLKEGLELISKN